MKDQLKNIQTLLEQMQKASMIKRAAMADALINKTVRLQCAIVDKLDDIEQRLVSLEQLPDLEQLG